MSDPEKKKTFLSMFEHLSQNHGEKHGKNGHAYPQSPSVEHLEEEDLLGEDHPYTLTDELDHEILMHRDAHFGGDFSVMLDYYQDEENIGVHPDFEIERISYLAEVEKEVGQDLASVILTGAEAEAVGRSRKAYAQLKDLYTTEETANTLARLIADLILSEKEEPEEEIAQVVAQGARIVPDLLALLEADEFYNPLFPGYGFAPCMALVCLGEIQDPRAVIPIFETFSKHFIFDEMAVVDALAQLGEPAEEFLLKILKSRPLTHDNPNAAFALIAFSDKPEVIHACFEQLQDPNVQDKPLLTAYLLSSCHSLNQTPDKESFMAMALDPKTPKVLRSQMQQLIKEWD